MAYELTPRRLAAARANIQKAWAEHRAGRVRRSERPPNLKHGFFARNLRQSVVLLGEDVREYDAHLRRFEDALLPLNGRERRIVRRLAEAAWRLIRGYRARAQAQTRKLRKALERVAPHTPLDPFQTKVLAVFLVKMFSDEHYVLNCVTRLRNQFERLFRLLLIERTGSDQGLRIFSYRRFSKWDQAVPFH
jgi:hypothetical protein